MALTNLAVHKIVYLQGAYRLHYTLRRDIMMQLHAAVTPCEIYQKNGTRGHWEDCNRRGGDKQYISIQNIMEQVFIEESPPHRERIDV